MGNAASLNNFLYLQKDMEEILNRCFSNQTLLKLLYYNTPECLDKPDITDNNILKEISKENIKIVEDLNVPEKKNSMIVISFDSFVPNETNPQFIDNYIIIHVFCPNESDVLILDDYMLRPFRIMHEINAMLNNSKLSGIGVAHFFGATKVNTGSLYGYKLVYNVVNNV